MSHDSTVPFNRPHITGDELEHVRAALNGGHLSSGGPYTARCSEWLRARTGATSALLTNSCTAALEMSALLAEIRPGDEVILPSFSFVTTASAFVLRGAVPVFVDIRPDTLNIDEKRIEAAVTSRTRVIVPMHYAGVACEMDAIREVAERHNLLVVEDAAQCLGATYRGRELGTIGNLGALSFHDTKNLQSGEGGALLVNDARFRDRAEVLLDKGTDRAKFVLGQVDKYSWVDLGSSFAPSEITAAFLWAQLAHADEVTPRRRRIWDRYHEGLADLERRERLRRPIVPAHCQHNGHLYYVLARGRDQRDAMLRDLREAGIQAVFHYIPLHDSPAGRRFGRVAGGMDHTDDVSDRLLRLPLWVDMSDADVERVVSAVDALA